jgi:hypothetical protein
MPLVQKSIDSLGYQPVDERLIAEDIEQLIEAVNQLEGGGGSDYTETIVNISSANFLTSGVSPVTLIAAAGEGKYFDIQKIIIEYTGGASGYTFDANDLLAVYYNGGPFIPVAQIATTSIEGTSNAAFVLVPSPERTAQAGSFATNPIFTGGDVFNMDLVFGTWSGSNPSGGNGTLRVIVYSKERTFGA